MKKILSIGSLLIALLMLSACNKFLEIYPDDRLVQEQITKSEYAANYALNGIYAAMARQENYGAALTTTFVEVLAQRYNIANPENPYFKLNQYMYGANNFDEDVDNQIDAVWTGMYVQILAINDFFEILSKLEAPIQESRKNILQGEAYALRALHHFDLLRLFGPVPTDASSWATNKVMPYNNQPGAELLPLLTAEQVTTEILNDLTKAEELLANDPIITMGINKVTTLDLLANFYINRHLRMNYYAVKALQARVYLWIDRKAEALAAANTVIDAQKNKKFFDWMPRQNILRGENPDRIFSTEMIFGIYSADMYNFYNRWFAGSLDSKAELCPSKARLDGLLDDPLDLRHRLWRIPENTEKEYRTCYKYAQPTNVASFDTIYSYIQPLMRITEMYYIAAECSDETTGKEILAMVREKREMTNDISANDINDELRKEYAKELHGEGQLFFFYKRKNLPNIVNADATTPMNAAKYVVPLPMSELSMR